MHTQQNFFVYRPLLPESEAVVRSLQENYLAVPSFEPVEDIRLPILTSQTWESIEYAQLLAIIRKAPDVSRKPFNSEIIDANFGPAVRDMTRRAINLVLNDDNNRFLEEHKRFKAAVQKADDTVYVRPFTEPYITIGHLDDAHALTSLLDSAKALVGQSVHIGSTESTVGKVDTRPPAERIRQTPREIIINEPVRTIKPGGIPKGLLNSLRPRE